MHNNFISISFPDDIVPQRLEMVVNPGSTTLENGMTVFTANVSAYLSQERSI